MKRRNRLAHSLDLTGHKYSRWTVLRKAYTKCKNGGIYWVCRCDCGNEREVLAASLRNGRSNSCGCRKLENISTHRMSRTPTYQAWRSMLNRCYNGNTAQFANYGGRGIKVCERWLEFENFYADMGDKPSGLSLDRHPDFNGDYGPNNCRWATQTEQIRNKQNTARIEYRGALVSLAQVCEERGVPLKRTRNRLRAGWSLEGALLPEKQSTWHMRQKT